MGYTHIVQQLLFSLFISLLTFDFDFIFGMFLTTVLGSTHVVEQLSFSMLPLILTVDFDLISGSFLNFWGPNGLFLGFGN